MNHNIKTIRTCLVIVFLCASIFIPAYTTNAEYISVYYPPGNGQWLSIEPKKAGFESSKLKHAIEYARKRRSSGIIVLFQGRILAEHYWDITPQSWERSHYKNLISGKTSDGRLIEDVASIQKSVVSFLSGIARERGKLNINRTVTSYLRSGWSKALPEKENMIRVRHLLSMSSGLKKSLEYESPAGSMWKYNTRAYSKMVPVLEAATGIDIHTMTSEWLLKPIGMSESSWIERRWLQDHHDANRIGFSTSARDLAKFGLLIYANGIWDGKAIVKNARFLDEALKPSQHTKPHYGLLWWLNNTGMYPDVPNDAFMALGSHTRILAVIPSQKLVVVRIGNRTEKKFGNELLKLILAARTNKT